MSIHQRNDDNKPYTKEDSYKNLDRVNFWISNCDSKASFVLAFLGIFIGVFFTSDFIYDHLKILGNTLLRFDWNSLKTFVAVLSLTFLVLFIFTFIKASKNTLNALTASINTDEFSHMGVKTDSILHFASIKMKGFNTHLQEIENLKDEKNLIHDIESQVAINSVIAFRKISNYKGGVAYSKEALFYFVLFLLFSILLKVF